MISSDIKLGVRSIRDISFTKYEAAGNDFIVVSTADLGFRGPGARSKRLADFARAILARHTGVGADGLFAVGPPADAKHDAAVRILNADGSEAEMSGNGIRCAAAWLLECRPQNEKFDIETVAGVKTAELIRAKRGEMVFRVAMGEPILDPKRIPFRGQGARAPVVRYPLPTSLGPREVTVTSMGNPHCSTFVESFEEVDWRSLGREIENHTFFPNRTNAEFIRVLGPHRIEVRFWERGVGETASSGTGGSAAAVASVLNGLTGRKITLRTAGGILDVEWSGSNQVFLRGPVRRVARGSFEYLEATGGKNFGSGNRRARSVTGGRQANEA
jgi:diaminopimelate epimerase